jgi:RNase H-like domain found in reverse transcriptase/Integrase zinc binding domain/Reverse transcriptase (RNA-dependent DNA polymerase)
MGYYHIELSPNSKRLCTIVLPWGKYEYQRLPMGLCNSPDIFQEKMSTLMQDLEFVRAYIDDLLCITKGDWYDHLDKLDAVLQRLQQAGLKVNAKKSFFGKDELEYLGYMITRTSIEPVPKKVKAILAINEPKTVRDVRRFVGMVNYYRDFWIRRSEILAPLTKLCSKTTKWEWGQEQKDAFELMKRQMAREVQLSYPNFNEEFEIHTDASDTQLGAVISQKGRPIAFYSRKLQSAQKRYTTTERELLAIVETLKEFRNILLGQKITIYTDHKNLTHKNFNTDRVMRWRLILEEYGPTLKYIKGETNIVADALTRLDITQLKHPNTQESQMAECLGLASTDLPDDAYPLTYKNIMREQQKDNQLLKTAKSNKRLKLKTYRGGGKTRKLITLDDKIVIPQSLRQRTVQWYHTQLCHPGEKRTEETIRQHFTWKNLREDVKNICQKCHTCQTTKRSSKKYGLLPEKEAEAEPWDKLCVDLIGPYNLKRKNKNTLKLWCVTMIDPATGWFEMKQIENKEATTIANKVETTWLTRYPWPTMITYDQGTEFMAEFAAMVKNDYGIKPKGITKRNPQANAIIERIHQTIGNIIRTFEVQDNYLDEDDPWEGILAATMFAVRATYHTTLQATPAQLVFGRDAILNIRFEANWNYIKEQKQKLIHKNNKAENAKRIPHKYKVGDKVLFREIETAKYGNNPWTGPYIIRQVRTNGSVLLQKGAVIEPINIRLIKPYKE